MDIFFSNGDRVEYLSLLSQSASKHSSNFLAWCLVSNQGALVSGFDNFIWLSRQFPFEKQSIKAWREPCSVLSTERSTPSL